MARFKVTKKSTGQSKRFKVTRKPKKVSPPKGHNKLKYWQRLKKIKRGRTIT